MGLSHMWPILVYTGIVLPRCVFLAIFAYNCRGLLFRTGFLRHLLVEYNHLVFYVSFFAQLYATL